MYLMNLQQVLRATTCAYAYVPLHGSNFHAKGMLTA